MYVLKNGIRAKKITFLTENPPQIDCNADAEIRMTMSGSFAPDPDVDFLKDELQPVVTIDGQERSIGVFRPATVREVVRGTKKSLDVEAYDRAVLLSWGKVEDQTVIAAGRTYESVITSYLTAVGLSLISFTPTAATLQTSRIWPVGTSYLEIVNELLDEISYEHVWFDGDGYARLEPYVNAATSAPDFTYGDNAFRLVVNDYQKETDIYSKPNVFIVVMSNIEDTPMVATAENNSLMSELSTVRRGIRIPEVTYVDNIAGQDELQAYADMLRNRGMGSAETVSISTAIQPGHGVGDVVAITDPRYAGVYREVGWEIDFRPGPSMHHTLRRVIYA